MTLAFSMAAFMVYLDDVGWMCAWCRSCCSLEHADLGPLLHALGTCRSLDDGHRRLVGLHPVGGALRQQHFMTTAGNDAPHALALWFTCQAGGASGVLRLLVVG